MSYCGKSSAPFFAALLAQCIAYAVTLIDSWQNIPSFYSVNDIIVQSLLSQLLFLPFTVIVAYICWRFTRGLLHRL